MKFLGPVMALKVLFDLGPATSIAKGKPASLNSRL